MSIFAHKKHILNYSIEKSYIITYMYWTGKNATEHMNMSFIIFINMKCSGKNTVANIYYKLQLE